MESDVMIDQYLTLASYLITATGIILIANSLLMLVTIISIRPANRKPEYFYMGVMQLVFEFVVGIWVMTARPLFVFSDTNFIIGILAVAVFTIMFFLRLYFINVLRAMFGK